MALAAELGCDTERAGFGGVHVIASGEQTADAVRATYDLMWQCPMAGSGWKVLIVNECDRMSAAAETIWLDRLEQLPPKTVVVFTTNHAGRLSERFRDRCTRLEFTSGREALEAPARMLAAQVWRAEFGMDLDAGAMTELLDAATADGRISFRRLLQVIQVRGMTFGTPAGGEAQESAA